VAELGGRLRVALRGRSTRFWVSTAVVVALLAGLGTGGVLAGPALLRDFGPRTVQSVVPAPPRLALRPLPDSAPTPTAAGVAAALAGPAKAKELGSLSGVVLDPATGQELWSHDADKALAPGSANKVLTAAAVLLAVDPTKRLVTKVMAGPAPDSVVLVGGGDPTLSALPDGPGSGPRSVYRGAAKLATLAEEVKQAHPGPIHTVLVDTSLFSGSGVAPGWEMSDIQGGNFTPISALITDGGRTDPTALDPPRTPTPSTDAGKAFAALLGANQGSIPEGSPPPGAAELGVVYSPPIEDLIENALTISDNVLAESLARQVALVRGQEPSFAGAVTAIRETLTSAGFDGSSAATVDGSGLSTDDRVPARLLGEIMAAAAGPDADPRAVRLRPLLWGLPVAGGTGTLGDRFSDASSTIGKGWVRAKTGTLTGVNALAGVVTDAGGRLLAFALMSNGTSSGDARPKLDDIAATLRNCGCR
jgi:D-alanyl-D-alanine carboxypeptidase/D-alanyl-D-alanine-endopeptidase (penicillin-binding protein 4)